MAQITWSKQAIEDIHTISEYHRQYSSSYAEALIDRIFEKGLLLEAHPQLGRLAPELKHSDIRELLYKPYRILYQVKNDDQVFILAVHHSAQPLTSATLFG
jgi:toxin ParE1/3/4